MPDNFILNIQPGNQFQPISLHLELFEKSVIKLILRLLNGTIAYSLTSVYEKGKHQIELNNVEFNDKVFFLFLEINKEVMIKKIEVK